MAVHRDFLTLIVAQPLYGALVAKLPRARFVPIVYHFFVVNLALFWLFLTLGIAPVIVARVFFVWLSVFSLFAIAVFWSFMADLFTAEQGKRLFGFIGAGGTAGGLLGPIITIGLSVPLGAVNLLIVAAILLELAVFCVYRLERAATAQAGAQAETRARRRFCLCGVAGTDPLAVSDRRRRLGQLAVVLCHHRLLRAGQYHFRRRHDRDTQTRIFAGIDLAVNLLSLATQSSLPARCSSGSAPAWRQAALPGVYVVGFAALFVAPTLAVVVTLQVVQRWMNFAIANPARQVFFTVLDREEKYKAKNLIDVVIYRGSDALYGWVFDSLQVLGLKLGAIALVALPLAAGWLVLVGRAGTGAGTPRRADR